MEHKMVNSSKRHRFRNNLLPSPQSQINTDHITFDQLSKRSKDENGFLHVSSSHISKEAVNPYYGYEIPGYVEQGLDPETIYYGYRKGSELEKGAKTFNGLPLLLGHYTESAETPQKEHRVGSLGTNASFTQPYLNNSIIITDIEAIEAVENKRFAQISCSYRYTPIFTKGEFNGEYYDFIMTNIRGNHVALVEEGRAGVDVAVADSALANKKDNNQKEGKNFMGKLTIIAKRLLSKNGIATDEAEVVEVAEKLVETVGEEAIEKALDTLPSFEDEATAILQNDALDFSQKIEALKKLSDVVNQEVKKTEALDQQMQEQIALDNDLDIDDLMKKAGLDPSDEGAKAIFMAGLVAKAESEQEKAPDEEQEKSPEQEVALTAKDANSIKRQARYEATVATQRHIMELTKASQHVRDLCGEVNPFAFDSARDIYKHALTSVGYKVATRDTIALKDMVSMAKDSKAKGAFQGSLPAMQKMDGHFKGLTRIKAQQ